MNDKVTDPSLIEQLAEEFIERFRSGEKPSVGEYVERHPELKDRIQNVLGALQLVESLGREAAFELPRPEPQSLGRLGDYLILNEAGRGGMGIVYEAEQLSLGRHVALKVFPPTWQSNKRRRARFQREARAAAMLHHTNIVPVFSVGEEDGQLYYAMQFIRGQGLDVVLEQLREFRRQGVTASDMQLTPEVSLGISESLAGSLMSGNFGKREAEEQEAPTRGPQRADSTVAEGGSATDVGSEARLPGRPRGSGSAPWSYWYSVARMGVQASDALHYAHGRGVLHRDIKPSNLLLDTSGTVWVTDFGLAKSLDQDDLTQTGELVGTLRYLPPEQFEGQCDARSDVYSLGLTLYELLTLTPAFDDTNRERLVVQVTTANPISPRKLVPSIPRNLETIVLKAIAREPRERYATAGDLADDLQRFLNDEPIRARRDGPVERLRRWGRRNPALASAILAIVMIVCVAFAVISWKWRDALAQQNRAEVAEQGERTERLKAQAHFRTAQQQSRRAEANYEQAVQALDRLTRVGAESLSDVPGLAHVRRRLLQDALQFYQDFLAQNAEDASLALETARAHQYVASLHYLLGEFEPAQAALDQAVAICTELKTHDPLAQRYLAKAHNSSGLVRAAVGRYDESEAAYRTALDLSRGLIAQFPHDADIADERAATYSNLASLLARVGDRPQANVLHGAAADLQEELVRQQPNSLVFRGHLAASYVNRGMNLFHLGRLDDAEHDFREAIQHLELLRQQAPSVPKFLEDLSKAYKNLGDVLERSSQHAAARDAYHEAIRYSNALAADFPGVPRYRSNVAEVYQSQSSLLVETGNLAEAETKYRETLRELELLMDREPDVPNHELLYAQTMHDLGLVLRKTARSQEARDLFSQAARRFEQLAIRFPEATEHPRNAAVAYGQLATLMLDAGQIPEAEQAYRRALQLEETLIERSSDVPQLRQQFAATLYNFARLLESTGAVTQAIEFHNRAFQLRSELAEAFSDVAEYRHHLAMSYNSLSSLERQNEQDFLRRALEIWTDLVAEYPKVPAYRHSLAGANRNLASVYRNGGHLSDALSHNDTAVGLWRQLHRESPNSVSYRIDLANALNQRGQFLYKDRPTEAEAAYRESLELMEPVSEESAYQLQLAGTRSNLGLILTATGRPEEAESLYRTAIESLTPPNPRVPRKSEFLGNIYTNLGSLLRNTERAEAAESPYQLALAIRIGLVDAFPKMSRFRLQCRGSHRNLGFLYMQLKRPVDAAKSFREATQISRQLFENSRSSAAYRNDLVNDAERLGVANYRGEDWEQAVEAFDESDAIRGSSSATSDLYRAMALWQQGERESARSHLRNTLDSLPSGRPPTSFRQLIEEARSLIE